MRILSSDPMAGRLRLFVAFGVAVATYALSLALPILVSRERPWIRDYGLPFQMLSWMAHPLGWLANPCFVAGLCYLATRRWLAAVLAGALAFALAVEAGRWWDGRGMEGISENLAAGYYVWLISMALIAVAGVAGMLGLFGSGREIALAGEPQHNPPARANQAPPDTAP